MEYLQYSHYKPPYKDCNTSLGFKPYYKWNTFNTSILKPAEKIELLEVLNLIINGIPSILSRPCNISRRICNKVLNLIINGIPSILVYMTTKKLTVISEF